MAIWPFKQRVGRSHTIDSTHEKKPAGSRDGISLADRAHLLHGRDLVAKLKTSQHDGLTESEAQKRLQEYGENLLQDEGGVGAFDVLIRQMANALTLVLVAAMALSWGVRDFIEGAVITAVIVLNVVVGFFQEYKAEKTMQTLRSLSSPTAVVIRDGESKAIPARHVVPGDICLIKMGDVVPADMRLLTASNLEADEALLTGEALPVQKIIERLQQKVAEEIGVGDRINMLFASATIVKGRATGIVVGTGMGTQIGSIAKAISSDREEPAEVAGPLYVRIYEKLMLWLGLRTGTPLQMKLGKLAYILLLCAIILGIIVFGVARFRVNKEVTIYAIALGIAVIPESLIAVLTITMSAGASRMARQHVLIRKLNSLEALGGVTDICSDKTGTLTQGKMIARRVVIPSMTRSRFLVVEPGPGALVPEGRIFEQLPDNVSREIKPGELDQALKDLTLCSSLNNMATLTRHSDGKWTSTGDPTEVALQVFAHKLKLGRPNLVVSDDNDSAQNEQTAVFQSEHIEDAKRFRLLIEYPFDSALKRMATVYQDLEKSDEPLCLLKGAVENVLSASDKLLLDPSKGVTETAPLNEEKSLEIMRSAEELAGQGLRVLALASRRLKGDSSFQEMERSDVETHCTFLGLIGIYDPPRPETIHAVRACQSAGITVHMLTGDHRATAAAVAQEIEIVGPDAPKAAIMTASEFDRMTAAEVDALPELPLVIARCSPETKVRMIEAGRRRSKFMVMTGDGVNDAPSLKLAPVGIAMGLGGSDVSKDAADLVLTDDNFDSIRSAVSEGRRLFDNIQRFILHLLSTNIAEVILLIIGLAFMDDDNQIVYPLSPLSILWINMITSGPPAFGLGLEKAALDIMDRPPHDPVKGVFTKAVIIDTIYYGTIMGTTGLLSFVIVLWGGYGGHLGHECNRNASPDCIPVFRARSTVFATLTFQILVYAWELKSFNRSLFRLSPNRPFYEDLWANQMLFWAVLVGCLSVPLAIYIPVLNTRVFYQAGITWEWGVAIGMTITFIAAAELWKIFIRPATMGPARGKSVA